MNYDPTTLIALTAAIDLLLLTGVLALVEFNNRRAHG